MIYKRHFKYILSLLKFHLSGLFGIRRGVLVYVGLHRGTEFDAIFKKYRFSIGIEANPTLAAFCADKYRYYGKSVKIIHGAATTYHGKINLNISNQDGGASSIGTFSPQFSSPNLEMTSAVEVPAIHIPSEIAKYNITFIDEYISDIQGMDYTVLETLTDLIKARRINHITCETTKDGFNNIYHDLPSNELQRFKSLLSDTHEIVAYGWGLLEDNHFQDVPDDWWEFDCRWKLKNN